MQGPKEYPSQKAPKGWTPTTPASCPTREIIAQSPPQVPGKEFLFLRDRAENEIWRQRRKHASKCAMPTLNRIGKDAVESDNLRAYA